MGVYTAPGHLAYASNGASLNGNLPLNPGTYNAVVEEWDNCGGAATSPVTITVGNAFSNLQKSGGWAAAGQGPPEFLARHESGDWGDLCEQDRQDDQFGLERVRRCSPPTTPTRPMSCGSSPTDRSQHLR